MGHRLTSYSVFDWFMYPSVEKKSKIENYRLSGPVCGCCIESIQESKQGACSVGGSASDGPVSPPDYRLNGTGAIMSRSVPPVNTQPTLL